MLGKCFGKSAATKRERYSFDDSIQDQFARGSMRSLFIDETMPRTIVLDKAAAAAAALLLSGLKRNAKTD